jgi:hypothetical protein
MFTLNQILTNIGSLACIAITLMAVGFILIELEKPANNKENQQ